VNKILIEHSGTSYYNKVANETQDLIEYVFGLDAEQMIGEEDGMMTLYVDGEPPIQIGEFSSVPNQETLRLFISIAT
jgi:hypothetical protein